MSTESQPRGPIEDKALPPTLQARVVATGPRPRIHGYDVHGDVARHYGFVDALLLALTGDLPDDAVSRAFGVAMTFASAVTVAEGPSHAAVVARVCGPRAASVVAVAAMGLAEQARALLDRHEVILPKLAIGSLNGSAAKFAARDDDERAAVERLREALGTFASRVPAIGYDVALDTALIATLMACGLRSREKLEVAFTVARLGTACAEALTWQPGDLRGYPMDVTCPASSTKEHRDERRRARDHACWSRRLERRINFAVTP